VSDQPQSGTPNINCPNCGTVQLSGTQFCTNCGALLAPVSPPQPEPSTEGAAPPPVPFESTPGAGYSLGEPPKPPYPVSLEFNGPEQLGRLSAIFRLILAIPLFIFLYAVNGVVSGLVIAHWLSLLVRGGRPVGWIGSAIVALLRFHYRAFAYLLLLSDKYPAFEGEWFLQLEMQRPERLRRRQIFFWKTLAVIPHFIVLSVLWFGVSVCVVIGWISIVFSGRFPLGLRWFVIGFLRWSARVIAYWMSMRDEFPPYSLASEAGAGSRAATGFSALGGGVLAALITVFAIVGATALTGTDTEHVSYARLTDGQPSPVITINNIEIQLTGAQDDYSFPGEILSPAQGMRLVALEAEIYNGTIAEFDVSGTDFEVRDSDGDKSRPVFTTVRGLGTPVEVRAGALADVLVVFEVGAFDDPAELRYSPERGLKDAKFVFD